MTFERQLISKDPMIPAGTFEKQPADIEHQMQPTDIAIECASEEIQRS